MSEYDDIERAHAFIESHEWHLANSMPQIPHWYCLRKDKGDNEEFLWFVRYIKKHSIPGQFYGKMFRYYYQGGYKYWTMDERPEDCDLINRDKMTPDDIGYYSKRLSFFGFEKRADEINHPKVLTEEELRAAEEAKRRIDRWTQEWFDDDEDPDDDGTTDPVEFARLERELAALRLKLEQNVVSEEEYERVAFPFMEAMYALLKD